MSLLKSFAWLNFNRHVLIYKKIGEVYSQRNLIEKTSVCEAMFQDFNFTVGSKHSILILNNNSHVTALFVHVPARVCLEFIGSLERFWLWLSLVWNQLLFNCACNHSFLADHSFFLSNTITEMGVYMYIPALVFL